MVNAKQNKLFFRDVRPHLLAEDFEFVAHDKVGFVHVNVNITVLVLFYVYLRLVL